MAGQFLAAFRLGQLAADAGGQRRLLDEAGHLLVMQTVGADIFALARDTTEQPLASLAKRIRRLVERLRPDELACLIS
ncbi:hypothetical protein J2Y48_002770 [Mycoplana sp. BE70]|nr:hypothetical protein [Mycoplana sp. BE70]